VLLGGKINRLSRVAGFLLWGVWVSGLAQFEPHLPDEFSAEAAAFLHWTAPRGYETQTPADLRDLQNLAVLCETAVGGSGGPIF
jgi:hypothetical protein